MNTTESLSMLWVPIVTTGIVGAYGVREGFGLLGIGALCVSVLYIVFMRWAFMGHAPDK